MKNILFFVLSFILISIPVSADSITYKRGFLSSSDRIYNMVSETSTVKVFWEASTETIIDSDRNTVDVVPVSYSFYGNYPDTLFQITGATEQDKYDYYLTLHDILKEKLTYIVLPDGYLTEANQIVFFNPCYKSSIWMQDYDYKKVDDTDATQYNFRVDPKHKLEFIDSVKRQWLIDEYWTRLTVFRPHKMNCHRLVKTGTKYK